MHNDLYAYQYVPWYVEIGDTDYTPWIVLADHWMAEGEIESMWSEFLASSDEYWDTDGGGDVGRLVDVDIILSFQEFLEDRGYSFPMHCGIFYIPDPLEGEEDASNI